MSDNSRQGIGVSPGVAIGPALVLERRRTPVTQEMLAASASKSELDRLATAVNRAAAELDELKERTDAALGHSVAQIFDAQSLLLEDSNFMGEIEKRVTERRQNAEWAVRQVGRDLSNRLSSISDVYLRERGTDVDDLTERLLRALVGDEGHRLDQLVEPVVLFAHDLTPSETAQLETSMILGFATDIGSRTSHTAIVARSLEIPAVVGLHDITALLQAGETVILDGDVGAVIVAPSAAAQGEYARRQEVEGRRRAVLDGDQMAKSVTTDGFAVSVLANVDRADEAATVLNHGGEGVGLFRSEYLYLRQPGKLPSEEEHYEEYRSVLEHMAPRPVSVRTLDIGGEKLLPADPAAPPVGESLLGLRALRLALRARHIFRTQLRGMLRASVHGKLQIMLPFVSGVEELREARQLIAQVHEELTDDGHEVADSVPVGVMLEVPAGALTVDLLAADADFFAIGSNDLIQYMLAVDRADDAVAHLYEPLHPAVLRVLRQIVSVARDKAIPVSMCGEMAAEPLTAMMLLGFGVEQLSMNAVAIPMIKGVMRRLSRADAEQTLEECLHMATAREIEEFALQRLKAVYPDFGASKD